MGHPCPVAGGWDHQRRQFAKPPSGLFDQWNQRQQHCLQTRPVGNTTSLTMKLLTMNIEQIYFMNMKQLLPFFVSLFTLALPASNVFAQGANNVGAGFADQMQSVESLYQSGQSAAFIAKIKELAKSALDAPEKYPPAAPAKILDVLTEKMTNSADADLPSTGEQLVLNIIQSDRAMTQQSQDSARSVASFLGAIRSERIPNFVELPVSANVAPPDDVPGGFAGMDPNAISDPAAKGKYLEALKSNERNNSTNKRQAQLEKIDRRISGRALDYIDKVVKKLNVPSSEVDKWVASGKFNELEKARIAH